MKPFMKSEQSHIKSIKVINKLRILSHLYWNTGETQLSLSHALKLSSPTITQALQQFKECKLLIEGGEKESSGGRKPREILFHYDAFHSVGVEIRRRHFRIVVINLKGDIIHSQTTELIFASTRSYWRAINTLIMATLESLPQVRGALGVGIAFPGELSSDGRRIERSTVLGIKDEPLDDLATCFDLPVRIEYGANAAGFGAVWLAKNLVDAIYLIITDNGIAGSLIINNQIFRGSSTSGKAGAFGHMVLRPNGKQCFCGGNGCWATYCALSNLYSDAHSDLEEFFQLLKENQRDCQVLWEEYLTYFAQALSNIKLSLDMNIIIGGKLASYIKDYLPELNEKVNGYPALQGDKKFISLDQTGENAQALGAALMFTDDLLSGRSTMFPIQS